MAAGKIKAGKIAGGAIIIDAGGRVSCFWFRRWNVPKGLKYKLSMPMLGRQR
jgi:hypothetical protein